MNKTVTINLSGLVFQVDEQAYQDLNNYLKAIKGRFQHAEGGEEIIADIEARIAEMFSAKLSLKKQVIQQEDVDEMIGAMGRPEEFGGVEDEEGEASFAGNEVGERIRKRLFRDSDDKVLGGVCSGISAYFGINDPIYLRLLFAIAILGFGTGLALYLILWIIIPKAQTTAEKLAMRGEPINISNIERSIKDEMEDLKNRFGESNGNQKGKARALIGDMIGFIISVAKFAVKGILKIVGVAMVAFGLIALLLTLTSIILGFGLGGMVFQSWMPLIVANVWEAILGAFGVFLVAGVPAIAILLLGYSLINRTIPKVRGRGLALIGLWVIGVAIVGVLGYNTASKVAYEEQYREEKVLEYFESEIVYLKAEPSNLGRNRLYEFFNAQHIVEDENDYILRNTDKYRRSNRVKLDVEKSPDNVLRMKKVISANGATRNDALSRAEGVEYVFEQKDSLLTFSDHFRFDKSDGLRGQEVNLTLYLPVGMSIYLDESMDWVIYDIKNITKTPYRKTTLDKDMTGHTWTMTGKGLMCQDCQWLTNEEELFKEPGQESYDHRDFNEVSVQGSILLNVVQGEDFNIFVSGSDKFKNSLHIVKSGDELKIKPKRGWIYQLIHGDGSVDVTMPTIEGVDISGNCEANISGFDEQNVNVDVSGNSEVDFDWNVSELNIDISGSSEVSLRGKGDQLVVDLDGASELKALDYQVSKGNIDASGASEANVNVTEVLSIDASGASEVKYQPKSETLPKILSDVSGFSSIKPLR